MLPDVTVNISGAAAPTTNPTNTGQCFAALVTQRGRIDRPMPLRSMQDFATYCGARLASSVASDWAETFYGEGGVLLHAVRVYGAGAAAAAVNLLDSGSGVSLVVSAGQGGTPDPGTWANGATGGLSVAVVAATGGYQLQTYLNGVLVESSPVLVTQQDAVDWSSTSQYIKVILGATALVPAVVSATNLAGGTDGAATADSDWQAALDRIPSAIGPGQVCAPGRTSSTGGLQLLAHALANNRWALIDGVDTSNDATLETAAAALYAAPGNGRRWGQLLAPWDVIPGLTAFSTRIVPPSARLAAQYARTDALGNPNTSAAGRNGRARFVIDLSQPNWTAAQRLALNTAGVTISRRRFGGAIVTYGNRSLADQQLDQNWSTAPSNRTVMAYVALAKVAAEAHEFETVDQQGRALGALKGDLSAPALDLWTKGALYGATPQEAFAVDVGPSQNTPTSLLAGAEQATVKLRTSPAPEAVVINIVKTPITQAI